MVTIPHKSDASGRRASLKLWMPLIVGAGCIVVGAIVILYAVFLAGGIR